jgi:hypothetical protein
MTKKAEQFVTIFKAADILGRDRQSIKIALKEVPPDRIVQNGNGRQQWKLSTVSSALLRYDTKRNTANRKEDTRLGLAGLDPIAVSQARLAAAKADKAEIELNVEMGRYIRADMVEQIIAHSILVAKRNLYSMPSKLAPHVIRCKTPIEAASIMRKELDAALGDISSHAFVDKVVEYARDGGKLPLDIDGEPEDAEPLADAPEKKEPGNDDKE